MRASEKGFSSCAGHRIGKLYNIVQKNMHKIGVSSLASKINHGIIETLRRTVLGAAVQTDLNCCDRVQTACRKNKEEKAC